MVGPKGPVVQHRTLALSLRMTAKHNRASTSNNVGGALTREEPDNKTVKIGAEPPSNAPLRDVYVILEISQLNAGDSAMTPHASRTPTERQVIQDALGDSLRFGCERVVQIGGKTTCPPDSTNNQQSVFDRPISEGYHDHASCADAEKPEGCLIHDLFGGDSHPKRLSQQLVTYWPRQRHLWQLTLKSLQAEDLGLIVEAIRYLDSHDQPVPCLGDIDVQLINPLYCETDVLRRYESQAPTKGMTKKDEQWRGSVCARYIIALRDRLADGADLDPAIYPGDDR